MQQSVLAILLGTLMILAYVWFRFEWQFAVGAMVTTLHDIVLVIGLYAWLQIDFDLTSIAAILTILGYSLNDTVVIYDRIRDMLRKYKRMSIGEILDNSINATFSRTIIVAATTFFATTALYLFGGEVLRGFSLAMLFGVVVGTYSTILIAAPILIYLGVRATADAPERRGEARERQAGPRRGLRGDARRPGRGLRPRTPPRSTPTATAASASPRCRIAARSWSCPPASGPGP